MHSKLALVARTSPRKPFNFFPFQRDFGWTDALRRPIESAGPLEGEQGMAGSARHGRKIVMRLAPPRLPSCVRRCRASASPARAQIGSDRYSSIVVDAATGNVLEAVNPDAPRHPASLAKMMTLYMAFEALRDRRITLRQLVPVSPMPRRWSRSKLGLMPGTRLTVEEAILGLVTKSANDAAAALGGTARRHRGPVRPDDDPARPRPGHEPHHLHERLRPARPGPMDHGARPGDPGAAPDDRFPWLSTGISPPPASPGSGRIIFNHDQMLRTYPGADGMKTGYTEASGPQPGHQRRARRRPADRRGAGRRLQPGARHAHGGAARSGLRADGCPAGAPHRRWPAGCPAWSARRMPRRWTPSPAGPPRAPRAPCAAALGHPGRQLRQRRRRASGRIGARRVADGGESASRRPGCAAGRSGGPRSSDLTAARGQAACCRRWRGATACIDAAARPRQVASR